MGTKYCNKCRSYKDKYLDFCSDTSRKDGRNRICRNCVKQRVVDYKAKYQRHKQQNVEAQKLLRVKPQIRLAGLISQAKRRAKSKGLDFDLDIDWAMNEFVKQNGSCKLTGIPFTLLNNRSGERYQFPYSPSIDRINPGNGYTKSNCRLVCAIVNFGLHRFGEEIYENVCKNFLTKKGYDVSKCR